MINFTPEDEEVIRKIENTDGTFINNLVDKLWSKNTPRPYRRFSIQWRPNFIGYERRLVLNRVYWNHGTPGDGKGYSSKVSISVCFHWYDFLVGLRIKNELYAVIISLYLIPFFPIRIHWKRSYGGSFI